MNSFERVMAILRGRKNNIDRLPAMNSVGTYTVDSMKAYDAFWPAAHKDPEKMARLAEGLHKSAGLDNVTVPFELTLEAEVFGAPLKFFEDKIKWPTVTKFTKHDISDIKFPKDISSSGRIPIITKAIKILKKKYDGKVPIIAYLNCPFTSISSYLVDSIEFLKWLKRKPEKIHDFYKETFPYYAEIANLYKDAGADIITFREEGASLDSISPKQFSEFIKPYLTKMIELVKAPRILHICGQCTVFDRNIDIIEEMVECGAEAITIDEKTPIKLAREIVDKKKPGYPIGGNIPSYGVIHQGPVERIREAVKKAIDEGVDMVAPGCDFWLETPTQNVKAFVDATKEFGTKQ